MTKLLQDPRVKFALAVVVSLLGAYGITVVISDDDGDGGADKVTVTLGKPAQQRPDVPDKITVPAKAVDQAHDGATLHADQRDETPAGVPDRVLDKARDQQDRLAASDQLPIVSPAAAPSVPGCRSRFVKNYSSRRGVRPRLLVVHYTVSPNRPGRSDVDAITALFNRPAFQASSHYVIDRDGNCNYIVRESDKSWTEAAGNPVSISVEVINSGRESPFMKAAGYSKLGRVFAGAAKRWQIPIQQGRSSGCRVIRAGIVDHNSFGLCGGGHVDVTPFSVGPVIKAAKRARCNQRQSKRSRRACLRMV